MKVLITGGSGFVGSNLADRLLNRGDEVLSIDNYETGRRDNLREQKNLTIVEGDICDTQLMEKLFSDFKPEVVVHCAASYKDPDNYIGDAKTNTFGTAVVVDNCRKHNVKRVIYMQTALCYGDPQEQPITLNHPLNPDHTSYAISKTSGEHYIQISGIENVTFRLANAYGPRNISGPLPTFFHRLSQDKKCFCVDTRRDFVFIEDLVNIVEKAVDGRVPEPIIFLVGPMSRLKSSLIARLQRWESPSMSLSKFDLEVKTMRQQFCLIPQKPKRILVLFLTRLWTRELLKLFLTTVSTASLKPILT